MWELLNELITSRHATMDYILFVNPYNAIKRNEALKKQYFITTYKAQHHFPNNFCTRVFPSFHPQHLP